MTILWNYYIPGERCEPGYLCTCRLVLQFLPRVLPGKMDEKKVLTKFLSHRLNVVTQPVKKKYMYRVTSNAQVGDK